MELIPIAAAFLPVLVFMVLYHALARWWKSQEGQNVMALAGLILLFSVVIFVRRAGLPEAALVMTNVLFFLVGATFLWRTVLLLRAQGFIGHSDRRPNPHEKGSADRG